MWMCMIGWRVAPGMQQPWGLINFPGRKAHVHMHTHAHMHMHCTYMYTGVPKPQHPGPHVAASCSYSCRAPLRSMSLLALQGRVCSQLPPACQHPSESQLPPACQHPSESSPGPCRRRSPRWGWGSSCGCPRSPSRTASLSLVRGWGSGSLRSPSLPAPLSLVRRWGCGVPPSAALSSLVVPRGRPLLLPE